MKHSFISMPRKTIVNSFLFFLFLSQCLYAQNNRPNIIYIMADDLGYADLGCYGRKDYATPNIDKLASQGVKFMNAYASAPVCTPTRVAFMTGLYPSRVPAGLREPIVWSAKDSLVGLTSEFPSIASHLQQSGYETFLVGKWHLGFSTEHEPRKNGFDYFYGFKGGAIDYISHKESRTQFSGLYENEKAIKIDGYMTDILKMKAVELISKHHEKPFFLSFMLSAPHWPWQAPDSEPYPDTLVWTAGGSAAIYASMMKSLDEAVGAVMKAVDDNKLTNNTVVIFTSDNGGERFSDMGIYKGKKMQLWEGGIRVPAFIRWPGKLKANTTTNQVAGTVDWNATILALAGVKETARRGDGISLLPILLGKQKEMDRELYWRITQRNQHKAMREGKWKYMRDEKGMEYLFDITIDPSETQNLKDKEPVVFNRLKEKYATWESTVLTPVPLN